MQSREKSFPNFDFEKEVERARWFKEDLESGGWTEAYKEHELVYWIKTFPNEDVPIKVVFKWHMPMPAQKFLLLLHPSTQESRHRWDNGFTDLETLQAYDDGGFVTYMRAIASWPLTDRSFVLYYSPIKETDWYGRQSFALIQKNASHPSKPVGEDGVVRAENGGNFFIAIPDESDPETACTVFGLTNNMYNGWVPNFQCLMARIVPRAFNKLREDMIKGYNMLYTNMQK